MLLRKMGHMVLFLLAASLSFQAGAQDLSRFDGLWVVDIRPTAAAWEKAGQPMDEPVYRMLSGHSMRLDFTKGTLVEGIVIGYDNPGEPFTAAQREEGVYALDVDGRRKRTFLWRTVDDDHVILSVEGGESPPLYFLRETLLPYSGLWKVADVEKTLAEAKRVMEKEKRRAGPEDVKKIRKVLATMRMRVDFDGKTMSWEDEAGEGVYGGPRGEFVVENRRPDGFTLHFGENRPVAEWRILGSDRITITDRGMLMEMVRLPAR